MGCNTCRSSCGDCPEGGITFKRVVRQAVPPARPVAVLRGEPCVSVLNSQAAAGMLPEMVNLLLLSKHRTKVQRAQGAKK